MEKYLREFLAAHTSDSNESQTAMMLVDVLFEYLIAEFADEESAIMFLKDLLTAKVFKLNLDKKIRDFQSYGCAELILRDIYKEHNT